MGVRSRVLSGARSKMAPVLLKSFKNLQAGYLGTSARHPCSVCSAWGEYLVNRAEVETAKRKGRSGSQRASPRPNA